MNWKLYWNESEFLRDADPCRQVGRTFRQIPYSPADVDAAVNRILPLLEPRENSHLLDLACGNGMLTSRLANHFTAVTAIDFSEPLIACASQRFASPNVTYLLGDALTLDETPERFDRIVMHCAFQYFSPIEAERLLHRLRRILKPGGIVVIADVADRDRLWSFYRGVAGRCRYMWGVLRDKPIIGQWWCPADLRTLAAGCGFSSSVVYQGSQSPNHYFRYDAVLRCV